MARNPAVVAYPQVVPVKAMACGIADLESQDANEICFCGDDGGFVIKKNDKYPSLPHVEWFCSCLARSVGVPQIDFSVIEHTDGNFWFGSAWKTGQVKDWWALAAHGIIDFSDLSEDISRIYAFDLFINNDDRHLNNYFVVNESRNFRIYSFDYSRSWLNKPFPLVGLVTDPTTKTVMVKEYLKEKFGNYFRIAAMIDVLDNISEIETPRIIDIIQAHPDNWLTPPERDAIISWWNSGEVLTRVNEIKAGIQNGALL